VRTDESEYVAFHAFHSVAKEELARWESRSASARRRLPRPRRERRESLRALQGQGRPDRGRRRL
jgi:hypothetical protein